MFDSEKGKNTVKGADESWYQEAPAITQNIYHKMESCNQKNCMTHFCAEGLIDKFHENFFEILHQYLCIGGTIFNDPFPQHTNYTCD